MIANVTQAATCCCCCAQTIPPVEPISWLPIVILAAGGIIAAVFIPIYAMGRR